MGIVTKLKNKFSPVPQVNKPITMSFPDAVGELNAGNKITRVEWNDPEEYFLMKDGYLMVHHSNGNEFQKLLIRDADVMATDWVLSLTRDDVKLG